MLPKYEHPNLVNFHVYTNENVPGAFGDASRISALKVDEDDFLNEKTAFKNLTLMPSVKFQVKFAN